MNHTMTHSAGLPDPEYDHAFYDGVPAKRFFAWIVDVILIALVSLILGLLTLTVLLWGLADPLFYGLLSLPVGHDRNRLGHSGHAADEYRAQERPRSAPVPAPRR